MWVIMPFLKPVVVGLVDHAAGIMSLGVSVRFSFFVGACHSRTLLLE